MMVILSLIKLTLFFCLCARTYSENFALSLYGWEFSGIAPYILDSGIPPPNKRPISNIPSACDPSPASDNAQEFAYSCPHLMMFSTDLILAAYFDKLDSSFFYAVAASQTDGDCGSCYQVKLLGGQRQDSSFKQLIVQVVNSGSDVRPGQFDLFIGGGGLGLFNACTDDCRYKYCQGGPCGTQGMYSGSFDYWNSRGCYGGGMSFVTNDNNSDVWEMCKRLSPSGNAYKDATLFQSCYLSNILDYHQNFDSSESTRVQCPHGLSILTGMRRNDDVSYPMPHIDNNLNVKCSGSASNPCCTHYMDCCKFSCSWPGKGDPSHTWNIVDSCDFFGIPIYR
jgi:hypothetical protein